MSHVLDRECRILIVLLEVYVNDECACTERKIVCSRDVHVSDDGNVRPTFL